MRVLVTGATGFVGRWLVRELQAAGHEAIGTPPSSRLDIEDGVSLRVLVDEVRPDAVAHLAGMSHGPDARADPERAMRINEGGTRTLVDTMGAAGSSAALLVASSSEVYGCPAHEDLPLTETAPVGPVHAYGRSKLAQEQVALALGGAIGVPVVVARAFNHTGPGQRADFVAPALTRRVLDARRSSVTEIRVGNIDVRRDFSDVRDVVRAYRLLLEGAVSGTVPAGTVVNVASGRCVTVRALLATICRIAGVAARPMVDPALVRAGDPIEIVGDASRLRTLTGWRPLIPLEATLTDLIDSLDRPDPGLPGHPPPG